MLSEKRIKEVESNVRRYINEDLLWKYKEHQKEVLETYQRNYKESLEVAEKLFNEKTSNLWVIVASYYSMYYAANAVLYKLGYKVGSKISHKITGDALIVLVRNKLRKSLLEEYEEAKEDALEIIGAKTDQIIDTFDKERKKRSVFQYESTEDIKHTKARTSLERAKKFIFEMKKLLEE
jgi:uncharacterized protein (UPF0332 family)